MKITKKERYFEVEPENEEDCKFIDYIESASEILIGGSAESIIGQTYRITKIRFANWTI